MWILSLSRSLSERYRKQRQYSLDILPALTFCLHTALWTPVDPWGIQPLPRLFIPFHVHTHTHTSSFSSTAYPHDSPQSPPPPLSALLFPECRSPVPPQPHNESKQDLGELTEYYPQEITAPCLSASTPLRGSGRGGVQVQRRVSHTLRVCVTVKARALQFVW